MQDFIKKFPDVNPSKWGLQDISLDKLWMAGDSINMVIKSLLHKGGLRGQSFTICANGKVLYTKTNNTGTWDVISEIARFTKVDQVTAEKMLKWLINASKYDSSNLLFEDCKSTYVLAGKEGYLILS